jgi:hypothetical protein
MTTVNGDVPLAATDPVGLPLVLLLLLLHADAATATPTATAPRSSAGVRLA